MYVGFLLQQFQVDKNIVNKANVASFHRLGDKMRKKKINYKSTLEDFNNGEEVNLSCFPKRRGKAA